MEVGVALFAERGFHGTGIKEIVDAAGVPKGSFYNYFQSKEDFAVEIIRYYSELHAEKWKTYLEQGLEEDALQRLYNSLILMIEYHEQKSVRTGCLVGNLSAELAETSELCREALRLSMDAWCQQFAYHIRRAQEQKTVRTDISAEELAVLFWNTWEGSLLRMKIENSTAPLYQSISLLFNGFFKPGSV